jgi:hypothetical protein
MRGQSVEESVLQVEECVGPEVEATDTACVKKAGANAQQIKRAYRLSKHGAITLSHLASADRSILTQLHLPHYRGFVMICEHCLSCCTLTKSSLQPP